MKKLYAIRAVPTARLRVDIPPLEEDTPVQWTDSDPYHYGSDIGKAFSTTNPYQEFSFSLPYPGKEGAFIGIGTSYVQYAVEVTDAEYDNFRKTARFTKGAIPYKLSPAWTTPGTLNPQARASAISVLMGADSVHSYPVLFTQSPYATAGHLERKVKEEVHERINRCYAIANDLQLKLDREQKEARKQAEAMQRSVHKKDIEANWRQSLDSIPLDARVQMNEGARIIEQFKSIFANTPKCGYFAKTLEQKYSELYVQYAAYDSDSAKPAYLALRRTYHDVQNYGTKIGDVALVAWAQHGIAFADDAIGRIDEMKRMESVKDGADFDNFDELTHSDDGGLSDWGDYGGMYDDASDIDSDIDEYGSDDEEEL